MSHRLRRSALSLALVLAALVAAPAAHAFPVTVNLRVEGPSKTVFDGPVTTDAHDVTTQTAGTHKCDGTNGAAEPEPGPDRHRRARRCGQAGRLHDRRSVRQLRDR